MASMPDETKKKISLGMRRAWASPTIRARRVAAARASWTPTRRQAFSRRMRDWWHRQREARAAFEGATP